MNPYLKGFIKRAAEYGLTNEQIKQAVDSVQMNPLLPVGAMAVSNPAKVTMPGGSTLAPIGMQPQRNVGGMMPMPKSNATPDLDFTQKKNPLAL